MTELTKQQQAEVKKEVAQKEKTLVHRMREHTVAYKTEVRRHTVTAIIAAFGLVIALSWQTVIKKVIDTIPKTGILLYHPYLTDLYTAIIVTTISVAAIMILSKWANQP